MSEGPPQPPASLRATNPLPEPTTRMLRAPAVPEPEPEPEPVVEEERAMGKRKKTERGGFRRKSQTARFDRCVKSVRKTVKARPRSTKESAAIAICTKTLLHRKGRTLKKYRKGKPLITQKRR